MPSIQYLKKDIQVEVFREDYGFVVYEGLHDEGFFLVVVKNHSSAYWSEQFKISIEDKEELLKFRTYNKALEIASRYK